MQRQHGDGRREPDAFRPRRDIGQHQIGAREHAERAEMMLADPGRVEADLFGIDRLVENIGDEGVGIPAVVVVVVVAKREIAEFHLLLPAAESGPPQRYNQYWYRLFLSAAYAAKSTAGTLLKVECCQHFGRTAYLFVATMIMGAECGN